MANTTTSEAAILFRAIAPNEGAIVPEAARGILDWKFPESDMQRMNELSQRAGDGVLSPYEQEELNNFERVGHLIAIAQSKARQSLQDNTSGH